MIIYLNCKYPHRTLKYWTYYIIVQFEKTSRDTNRNQWMYFSSKNFFLINIHQQIEKQFTLI